MKTQFQLSSAILVLVLSLVLGIGFSHGHLLESQASTNQVSGLANLPWVSQYVQQDIANSLHVGSYVSIAIRSFDDYPVMSYYDATNGNLMLAYPVLGHSGNCGTNNNWLCITLDGDVGDVNVGGYTSIDLWGTTQDSWKLGISYYDVTHQGLKAIIWTCSYASCSSHKISIVTPYWGSSYYGQSTSIKFNAVGDPLIAYYSYSSLSSDWLMFAHPAVSGGNCGEGDDIYLWQCDGIDYGDELGQFTSLDIGWDGKLYIAYYDKGEGNLKLATYTSSGNCGPIDDWQCDIIDGTDGSDVGLYASLRAPQFTGDPIRIAYYDKTNGHLKFYSTAGLKMMVDEMGTSLEPMGISLAVDGNGLPIIAYQYIESDFSPPALRITRPYLAFNDNQYGDCGEIPPGYSNQLFRCSTIDDADQYTWEADYVSMAVNSRGLVGIAYSEQNPYDYATSLKFTYQTFYHTYMPILIK
jgi:hypothetical protein